MATVKAVEQSVRRVVQTALPDTERRSKNVIVSGLAPSLIVADEDLFLGLCETHLSTKPLIVRDRCRRLGRIIEGKIQPLLVVLDSTDSVTELLRSAPITAVLTLQHHHLYIHCYKILPPRRVAS